MHSWKIKKKKKGKGKRESGELVKIQKEEE